MSLRIITMPQNIVRVRLKEDFSIPDEVYEEEEINPEEAARLEQERLERERFEQTVKTEVDLRLRSELDKQYNFLTEKYQTEKEESYKSGWEEGLKLGRDQTEAELEPIKQNLLTITEKLKQQRGTIISDAENVVVRLAYQMAQKIIGSEIERDPGVITSIVRDALKYIADELSFTVRINPQDFEVLEKQINKLATESEDLKDIKIIPDNKINRGGCVVESETGTIDARIETKLELIENVIKRAEPSGE